MIDVKKHNLQFALKKAALANDYPAVAKAAQDIFEAGYELEEMGYPPALFDAIASQVVHSGWVPKLTDEMIKEHES